MSPWKHCCFFWKHCCFVTFFFFVNTVAGSTVFTAPGPSPASACSGGWRPSLTNLRHHPECHFIGKSTETITATLAKATAVVHSDRQNQAPFRGFHARPVREHGIPLALPGWSVIAHRFQLHRKTDHGPCWSVRGRIGQVRRCSAILTVEAIAQTPGLTRGGLLNRQDAVPREPNANLHAYW